MEMSLVAVNICLVSSAFDTAAVPLSCAMCPTESDGQRRWDAEKTYRLVTPAQTRLRRGQGYPHCTIAQLCAHSTAVSALRKEVMQLWRMANETADPAESLSLLGIDNGPSFATTEDGTAIRLPNIKIERSDALCSLHEKVVSIAQRYHVPPVSLDSGKAAFHPNFPVNSVTSVEWMAKFLTDHALDAYSPHITLGATPTNAPDALPFKPIHTPWSECRLVVSHMGNYNSCFEIIS